MKAPVLLLLNCKKICSLFLLSIFCISIKVIAGIKIGDEPYHFKSKITNTEYSLLINLPNNYDNTSTKGYPVLYVLDGQWDFKLMVALYHNLRYDKSIPDIIIVGIAYYGENVNYDSMRAVDLTPSKNEGTINNITNGLKFLEVLKTEIIPYIDSNYATNKLERGISGTSLAGLYSHYLMFKANDVFNGFIAVNPYLVWDNEVSFKVENEYSKRSNKLNARVYMTTGEFDISDVFFRMIHQIESRNYTGIDFSYNLQKGIGHTGSKHDGYSRGLIHLFKQKTVNVSRDFLKKYTGNYFTESKDTVKLILDGNNLVIKKSKKVPFDIKLYTLSDSSFCADQSYIPFYLRENKETNRFEIHYNGLLHQLKAWRTIREK